MISKLETWYRSVPVGILIGRKFIGVIGKRDRIGTTFAINLRWFSASIAVHPAMWAGSIRCFNRLIWLRPINYEAIEAYQKARR